MLAASELTAAFFAPRQQPLSAPLLMPQTFDSSFLIGVIEIVGYVEILIDSKELSSFVLVVFVTTLYIQTDQKGFSVYVIGVRNFSVIFRHDGVLRGRVSSCPCLTVLTISWDFL